MARLCLYTLFNYKDEPLMAGVRIRGQTRICRLLMRGVGVTVHEVEENKATIAQLINEAMLKNMAVVTTDFKANLEHFPVPLERGVDYPVYDQCWSCRIKDGTPDELEKIVHNMLRRLESTNIYRWQRVFANAAVVYQDLQNLGLSIGGVQEVWPRWSQQTFSGRSKTSRFNFQGADESVPIRSLFGSDSDVFVYFDWIAADLVVAAHLSGDAGLIESFRQSDPYTHLVWLLGHDQDLDRDHCKLLLLSALNKMDVNSPIMAEIFPDMGRWLDWAKQELAEAGGLRTILGRRFELALAKNELAVLNGVFQGSVAHAMQVCVKKIWDRFGGRLVGEIHDSVAMTAPDPEMPSGRVLMDEMVYAVADIMTRPFAGLVDNDPFFPVKVSMGRQWRCWTPRYIFREGGEIEVLDDGKQTGEEEAAPPEEEGAATAETAGSA